MRDTLHLQRQLAAHGVAADGNAHGRANRPTATPSRIDTRRVDMQALGTGFGVQRRRAEITGSRRANSLDGSPSKRHRAPRLHLGVGGRPRRRDPSLRRQGRHVCAGRGRTRMRDLSMITRAPPQLMLADLLQEPLQGRGRFLHGRWPDAEPHDATVLANGKGATVSEVLSPMTCKGRMSLNTG